MVQYVNIKNCREGSAPFSLAVMWCYTSPHSGYTKWDTRRGKIKDRISQYAYIIYISTAREARIIGNLRTNNPLNNIFCTTKVLGAKLWGAHKKMTFYLYQSLTNQPYDPLKDYLVKSPVQSLQSWHIEHLCLFAYITFVGIMLKSQRQFYFYFSVSCMSWSGINWPGIISVRCVSWRL